MKRTKDHATTGVSRGFFSGIAGALLIIAMMMPQVGMADDSGQLQLGKGTLADGRNQDAYRTFRSLAEKGVAEAQARLGWMYGRGQGVPQDYSRSARWYGAAAEQGFVPAQYNLGVMYHHGEGVLQDDTEATRLYRLAAEQGYAPAQYNLGVMYHHGQSVPQDDTEAARWFRLAAEQGDASAQHNLGMMYAGGRGVPRNYAEAVRWYRAAAEQGNVGAQAKLGVVYTQGLGVPQNFAEAVRWYRAAAEQGDVGAQTQLGVVYTQGLGVPQNFAEAYVWFLLAEANGYQALRDNYQDLRDMLSHLEGMLTRDQIAESQELAKQRHREQADATRQPVFDPVSDVAEQRSRGQMEEEQRRPAVARVDREDADRRARDDAQRQAYIAEVQATVERRWRKPEETRASDEAVVLVRINPDTGLILGFNVDSCSGSGAFCASVRQTMERLHSLPRPPDGASTRGGIRVRFIPETDTGQGTTQPRSTILSGSVGHFVIGKTPVLQVLPEGYAYDRREETAFYEADEYTEISVALQYQGSDAVIATLYEDDGALIVAQVHVLSDQFSTPEGFRVGTALSEILRHHPNADIGYSYLRGDSIMVRLGHPSLDGVIFLIDLDAFTGDPEALNCSSDYCSLLATDFHARTAVDQIRVVGSAQ